MIKHLILLAALSFAASAHAGMEIQINGTTSVPLVGPLGISGGGGTSGDITIIDDGNDNGSDLGIGAEIYTQMSDVLQIGGLFSYSTAGDGFITATSFGALVRYNLSAELRDSVFLGGGLRLTTIDIDGGGDGDNIAIIASAGKRFAISDTLTWTPNITIALNVGGDLDEGHTIALNLLSFSGFMD